MKKYTWLALILCLALLAGCGIPGDTEPENTPGASQPVDDRRPAESEPSDGITPEPPSVADRKPVESREPASFEEPTPAESQTPQESSEPEAVPSPDIQTDVPVRADAEFCGEWFAREADSTGEVRAIKLILEEDGAAYFNYGVPYREMLEVFEGRWREEGENLVLDLYGGPISDDGNYEYDYCRDLDVKFRWEEQGIALICEHVSGNPLMPGTNGEWFTFRPFDAFRLSGTWYAAKNDGTEEYCLQLNENGSFRYSVMDAGGTLLAEYDGSWKYRDGQVQLSAEMCGGTRYDMGQRSSLAGTYREERSSEAQVVLAHESGSELTPAMEETGKETFEKH